MSEPRYWFIQKPVANNVPLERNGAVFVRHQPTVSEQNCEWVKVWSSEDLSKEMGMGVTKWVELNRKVRELELQLKEANEVAEFYAEVGEDASTTIEVLLELAMSQRGTDKKTINLGGKLIAQRARAYLKKWEGT